MTNTMRQHKDNTMRATLILDLGGVIMRHNIPACKARFEELIGAGTMRTILGVDDQAEGTEHSLMTQYELGEVSTEHFVDTLLGYARPGTTVADICDAWIRMHGGIPEERLALLRRWQQKGYRLFMLSNNNDLHWRDVFSRYDLSMFEHCFASHLLHCTKPGPEIYRMADDYLHAHGLPQPYYFVDDLETNRQAAIAFGWQTFPDLAALDRVLNEE